MRALTSEIKLKLGRTPNSGRSRPDSKGAAIMRQTFNKLVKTFGNWFVVTSAVAGILFVLGAGGKALHDIGAARQARLINSTLEDMQVVTITITPSSYRVN
jgi:hypothetical protein